MMGTETGKRKPIPAPHLAMRRDQAPSVGGADIKPRAPLHTPHHASRHHLLLPPTDNSSRLRTHPTPLPPSPLLGVPPTMTHLTWLGPFLAPARTNLNGKVLNSERVWNAQGRHISGTAHNKTSLWIECHGGFLGVR